MSVVTLTLYAFLGNELTPTKVFTSLALFNQLRFPIIFFPLLLNTLADGKVSLQRISAFLASQEIENYVVSTDASSISSSNNTSTVSLVSLEGEAVRDTSSVPSTAIEIRNCNFSWGTGKVNNTASSVKNITDSQSIRFDSRGILRNINLVVKPGELVAVVGPVASGKTMLLSAILGELMLLRNPRPASNVDDKSVSENEVDGRGLVVVNGRVAYVSQSAWIPNDSLRNVIIFGKEYNASKFQGAVSACNLNRDIVSLESG